MKLLYRDRARSLLLACWLLGSVTSACAVQLESLGILVPSGRQMETFLVHPEKFVYDNLRGYLIIADTESEQVAILDRQGVAIRVLGKKEKLGPPVAVAATGDGTLYIAERGSDSLKVLHGYDSVTGEQFRTLELQRYAKSAMVQPVALCVDADRNLYVVDSGNRQVLVFGPDEKFNFALAGLGAPSDVKVSATKIYVPDPAFGGIRVFDLKGRKLATLGTTPAQFREPLRVRSLAVDRRERLWALDESGQSITCLDSLGNTLFTTMPPPSIVPVDLDLDPEGNLYLLDRTGRGIAVYRILEF